MPSTSRHHAGPVAAALVAAVALSASLTGCNHTSFSPTVRGPTVTYTGGAIAATNDAKVVVDGQEHRVDGQIACIALDGGETMISIGKEPIAVKITLTVNRESPRVRMVILQNLVGYTLFVMDPPQKGEASASKDGKRYTIGGTSWGLDTHNDDVKKPFRIQFTCP